MKKPYWILREGKGSLLFVENFESLEKANQEAAYRAQLLHRTPIPPRIREIISVVIGTEWDPDDPEGEPIAWDAPAGAAYFE